MMFTLYLLKLIFIEEFGHLFLFEMVNFAFISAYMCNYKSMLMSQIITEINVYMYETIS